MKRRLYTSKMYVDVFQITRMNRTTNATQELLYHNACEDIPFFPPPDDVTYFVVLFIFTLGFIDNIVTVVVISCWRKRHTPTFTYLAVSDTYSLLLFTMDIILNIGILLLCNNIPQLPFQVTRATYETFLGIAVYNGRMQLCLFIYMPPFTAIVYPHKYQAYCTSKAVKVVSVVASVIILISSAVESALHDVLEYNCAVFTLGLTFNFIVPTTVFISLHCLKLRALRRSPVLNSNSSLKMTIILSILMSIYVISSGSILIQNIIYCHMYFPNKFIGFIVFISFLFNCAVNPFIYFFSSPPIVQFFRKMWHRLCKRCQVTDNGNAEEIEMNNIPTAWG